MPTTYTHDLFGKKIYRQLPDEMKKVIRKNGDLYRIGLHGPDILFYHLLKPAVNGTGVEMHHNPAAPFFLRGTSGLSSGVWLSLSSGQYLPSLCRRHGRKEDYLPHSAGKRTGSDADAGDQQGSSSFLSLRLHRPQNFLCQSDSSGISAD